MMKIASQLEYSVNFLFLPVRVLNSNLMNALPKAYLNLKNWLAEHPRLNTNLHPISRDN